VTALFATAGLVSVTAAVVLAIRTFNPAAWAIIPTAWLLFKAWDHEYASDRERARRDVLAARLERAGERFSHLLRQNVRGTITEPVARFAAVYMKALRNADTETMEMSTDACETALADWENHLAHSRVQEGKHRAYVV